MLHASLPNAAVPAATVAIESTYFHGDFAEKSAWNNFERVVYPGRLPPPCRGALLFSAMPVRLIQQGMRSTVEIYAAYAAAVAARQLRPAPSFSPEHGGRVQSHVINENTRRLNHRVDESRENKLRLFSFRRFLVAENGVIRYRSTNWKMVIFFHGMVFAFVPAQSLQRIQAMLAMRLFQWGITCTPPTKKSSGMSLKKYI